MRIAFLTSSTLIALLLVATACRDDRPEITTEQRLESIAGQDLTPAEVERQIEVATTLCQTDVQILALMWDSMTATQLRFQDYVFGDHCPQRSVDYALATGRSLTAQAHQAIVNQTTTTTRGPTTAQTLPLPTDLVAPGGDEAEPATGTGQDGPSTTVTGSQSNTQTTSGN